MEANYQSYDYIRSFERIDEIIESSDSLYEEAEEIPSRDKLTYTNGYYVSCSAIFADMRKSSSLSDEHRRPKLAKLYRSYISEIVAIMNGNTGCAEINIVGDCISGIFNTPYKPQIDDVFSTAAQISSLVAVLNCKFRKKDITPIQVGIGISYGRALMVQAGFKGSGIKDIIWMGDVINTASKLSEMPIKTWGANCEISVSSVFYDNLNERNQSLLHKDWGDECYRGCVINTGMNAWYSEHCR